MNSSSQLKKALRFGFAGLRHVHIFDLVGRAETHPSIAISGLWERDITQSLYNPKDWKWNTFTHWSDLLDESDVIAVGDTYGNRGQLVIKALKAGKHVIADKPLCVKLDELKVIQNLLRTTNLKLGLMLDLRDHPNWIGLKHLILEKNIVGSIQTVHFSGQHPLLRKKRPKWYFEENQHGGTLNDICIHAIDFIPWMTGLKINSLEYARTWNAKASNDPIFNDCAQCVFKLSNGAGVMGDVSYLAPDGLGYKLDNYWRVTVHGSSGMLETSYSRDGIEVILDESDSPEIIQMKGGRPGGYLEDFLADISSTKNPCTLDTDQVLEASEWALKLEELSKQRERVL